MLRHDSSQIRSRSDHVLATKLHVYLKKSRQKKTNVLFSWPPILDLLGTPIRHRPARNAGLALAGERHLGHGLWLRKAAATGGRGGCLLGTEEG